MRRVLGFLLVLLLMGGAGAGGFVYGTQQGAKGAFETASADRAAFAATPRVGGSVVAAGGGAGGAGGQMGGQAAAGGQGMMAGAGGQGTTGGQGAGAMGGAGGQGAAAMGGQGMAGAGGRGMGAGMPGTAGSPGAGSAVARTPSQTVGNITGRVLSIDGPALRVQGGDNAAVNVATSGSTLFQRLVAAGMGDLKVNDFVAVQGDRAGESVITARTITTTNPQAMAGNAVAGYPGAVGVATPAVAPPGMMGMGMGGAVVGRITQMGGNSLTLSTPGNMTITVNTTATTKVQTTQSTSLQEIRIGDTLVVVGERTGENGISARSIINQGTGG